MLPFPVTLSGPLTWISRSRYYSTSNKSKSFKIQLFCRPYLLYAIECLGLTATQMRSLRNKWQCAVSHIFNVHGTNVNFICATTDNASLDTVIAARRIKFLQSLQDVHGQHPVLHNLYARIGKRELFWVRTQTND